jgi:hypothetical protein
MFKRAELKEKVLWAILARSLPVGKGRYGLRIIKRKRRGIR